MDELREAGQVTYVVSVGSRDAALLQNLISFLFVYHNALYCRNMDRILKLQKGCARLFHDCCKTSDRARCRRRKTW